MNLRIKLPNSIISQKPSHKYLSCIKAFIIVSLIFVQFQTFGQKSNQEFRTMPNAGQLTLCPDSGLNYSAYISMKPITNREYITYLCWLSLVYVDYPEVLFKAFPGAENAMLYDSIKDELYQSEEYIKFLYQQVHNNQLDYLFSPNLIDYPVMGISWNQAMDFCNWLSDRYNESILIDKKIYVTDYWQIGEECFTTESYLYNQYEGLLDHGFKDKKTKEERAVAWNDHILFPAFRLPTRQELLNARVDTLLRPYESFVFLNIWSNYYIKTDGSNLSLRNNDSYYSLSTNLFDLSIISALGLNEYCIDDVLKNPPINVHDIYKNLNQDLYSLQDVELYPKDSLGHMQFLLIGEDKNSDPVLIERVYYKSDYFKENSILRFAVEALKK